MQSGRLLRVAARSATRYYVPRTAGCSSSQVHGLPRRPLCVNSTAAPRPPAQAPRSAKPVETTANAAKAVEGGSAGETSKEVHASKVAEVTTSGAVAGTEQGAAKMPDVSSTSLGLDDPMTNDPLKWRKFAWKYAGAVLLFFVSYKTLHWYVDRLEADGKRRRDEVEENKTIIQEMARPQDSQTGTAIPAMPTPSAVVANHTVEASAGNAAMPVTPQSILQQAPEEPLPPLRIFDAVKEEEPHLVSELDELYVYKIELETRLRDLNALERTREVDAQKLEVNEELKQLAKEIDELAAKKTKP